MTGQQAFERYIANAQRLDSKWDGWTSWNQVPAESRTAWQMWADGKMSSRALSPHYPACLPSREFTWASLSAILGQVG